MAYRPVDHTGLAGMFSLGDKRKKQAVFYKEKVIPSAPALLP